MQEDIENYRPSLEDERNELQKMYASKKLDDLSSPDNYLPDQTPEVDCGYRE